jgi:uncharacterized membrane-anchored protein YhcB (DUF1043 family)
VFSGSGTIKSSKKGNTTMKRFLLKICVAIIALILGIVIVRYISPKSSQVKVQSNPSNASASFSERREQSDTFFLDAGESVLVSNINGSVEIEYADATEVDVKVIRSANNQEDFDYRHVVLGESKRKLNVRMKKSPSLWALLGMIPEERQRVIIRVPRGTRVLTKCINGYTEERETREGKLKVKRTDSQCSQ